MANRQHEARPTMHGPAVYRICVRGRLEATWSDRLEGMEISESRGSDGEVETVLVGRLADQAALAGVLNTLYELHLPVLSVDCLGTDRQGATIEDGGY
jgi:hypothetical protein